MSKNERLIQRIKDELSQVSTAEKRESSERYFPQGINCIGATASDIKLIISNFHSTNPELSANEILCISEDILQSANYSEEVLTAFGLINPLVKKHFNDDLLFRFEYWLENYASNWSHVDDLCIKTIYNFLLARPHLIETTQAWTTSKKPWCRRASNVVWVKFIRRKIGASIYYLDKSLIFKNCDLLIEDENIFVQKSIGWLLKVTLKHHQKDVIGYLRKNHQLMPRSTIRYALEKLDKKHRASLLLEFK